MQPHAAAVNFLFTAFRRRSAASRCRHIDSLGQLNSWGNWPEQWIKSWHSTNSLLPLSMPIADLVKQDVRDEDPVAVDPLQLRAAIADALKALLPPHLLAGVQDARH